MDLLPIRTTRLVWLDGEIFEAPVETGEIGPGLFEAASRMGVEAWLPSTGSGATGPGSAIGKPAAIPAFSRVMDLFA